MNGAIEKYNLRVENKNSLACVGLDPDIEKIPDQFKNLEYPQFECNKWIIEQTAEYVVAYKPNIAFYEAQGSKGIRELEMTMEYLQEFHPAIFTICDAKRADIGNTSLQYAKALFDTLGFDAVTLNPYLGRDALQPFLEYKDKGCIMLCHTSNPGARELQELEITGKPVWQIVVEKIVTEWNTNSNCMIFMGATYPEQMQKARELAPDIIFLTAGIYTQGGQAKEVVRAGLNAQGKGLIVNSSRGVIFAENPGEAAKSLRDEINSFRS